MCVCDAHDVSYLANWIEQKKNDLLWRSELSTPGY